ncbi:MAG: helix-turn-helix transcriptional regulator [Acidimicrobiales bacterium]|nr:helix-turn-helix transcriptional regulator [Acidimicrobiales bacterium]
MATSETLGTRLRARRRAEGLTLAEVAERSELSLPYVSNLERGRGNPTIEALQALARALGTTLGALVGDEAEFDPFELVMAEAPKSLIAFSRSSRFTDQIDKLAEQQGVQKDELKRKVLVGMATSPRRSSGEPTEYDWLRLMDAYSRILEDG